MEIRECGALLVLMAQYDYREIDPAIAAAWMRLIGDLNYADAEQAVLAYYGETRERMMPADVISRVRAIRAARIRHAPLEGEPPDDPEEYLAWLRRGNRRAADGPSPLRAIGGAS